MYIELDKLYKENYENNFLKKFKNDNKNLSFTRRKHVSLDYLLSHTLEFKLIPLFFDYMFFKERNISSDKFFKNITDWIIRSDDYLEKTINKRLEKINVKLSEDQLKTIKDLDKKILYYLEIKDCLSSIKMSCELFDYKTSIYSLYFTNPESIKNLLKQKVIIELRECFYY